MNGHEWLPRQGFPSLRLAINAGRLRSTNCIMSRGDSHGQANELNDGHRTVNRPYPSLSHLFFNFDRVIGISPYSAEPTCFLSRAAAVGQIRFQLRASTIAAELHTAILRTSEENPSQAGSTVCGVAACSVDLRCFA